MYILLGIQKWQRFILPLIYFFIYLFFEQKCLSIYLRFVSVLRFIIIIGGSRWRWRRCSMRPDVLTEMIVTSELFLTVSTRIRFLTRMNSHVPGKMFVTLKPFLTPTARIWTLASVNPLVSSEMIILTKCSRAIIANERFRDWCFAVCFLRSNQIWTYL